MMCRVNSARTGGQMHAVHPVPAVLEHGIPRLVAGNAAEFGRFADVIDIGGPGSALGLSWLAPRDFRPPARYVPPFRPHLQDAN